MKEKVNVTGVLETMVQTLYARAKETRKKNAKINDEIAVELVDGFYGAYWKYKTGSDCAMIAMIGDDPEDYLARTSVKWLHKLGVNVMTMSPGKKIMDIIIIHWNV